MAVTLSVDLTDEEEAIIIQIAALIAPGMSPPQLKTWAETTMKQALRAEVSDRYFTFRSRADNDLYQTFRSTMNADWPIESATPPS